MKRTIGAGLKSAITVLATIIAFTFTACPNDSKSNGDGNTNQAPTANAGTDFEHNITTSGATITLNGSGTDADGSITGYAWTCTDKPTNATAPTFSNSAVANPTVSGFTMLGDYEFSLKVKDNENAESTADVVKVSLVRTATKNVEVSFKAFNSGDTSIDFTPIYTPAIAGGGFENGDVTFTLEDDMDNTFTNGIVNVSLYEDSDIPVFTQTFKVNGVEVGHHSISATVLEAAGKSFASLNDADTGVALSQQAIPSIDITISKKVSAGAITTTVDTTVEFVELEAGATIDFSPSTTLPDGVTYTVTDDSTPQKKWELYKNGFNGKITASEHYNSAGGVIFTQTFYLYGMEIAGANSKRTVNAVVSTGFATTFGAVGVSEGTNVSVTLKYPSPQYETVTKDVTVSFPLSASFGETLNLTPTYTPANGWGDFAESEITYTISDGTNNNLGNIINVSSYNDMDSITFTLTLTQGSNTVSQSFIGSVLNTDGLKFAGLFDNDEDWGEITIVPPIDITLSKQVEKQ